MEHVEARLAEKIKKDFSQRMAAKFAANLQLAGGSTQPQSPMDHGQSALGATTSVQQPHRSLRRLLKAVFGTGKKVAGHILRQVTRGMILWIQGTELEISARAQRLEVPCSTADSEGQRNATGIFPAS